MENTPLGTVVFNVVTPTLTAYLPERAKAMGTGVIIAPGGAFVALAIDLEGNEVARWLQEKGIAEFVLKYRILGFSAWAMVTSGALLLQQDAAARPSYAAMIYGGPLELIVSEPEPMSAGRRG